VPQRLSALRLQPMREVYVGTAAPGCPAEQSSAELLEFP
jgi:hypothetical protein